jgi:hypothetical protein
MIAGLLEPVVCCRTSVEKWLESSSCLFVNIMFPGRFLARPSATLNDVFVQGRCESEGGDVTADVADGGAITVLFFYAPVDPGGSVHGSMPIAWSPQLSGENCQP